ncbi:hypothetical protein H4217_003149 [Coemansia sp. RSA 1939]|nr:hypothetical protein H4217_003149 [Coemansia sp. RSA 1939]KAJ2614185.1 hypothetical protein EV177_002178 [Coemansia sp. RSA 1804]KAJ2687638.1 hypothetical protein GGH99_003215 [Coemansia sp. RSA 1285]
MIVSAQSTSNDALSQQQSVRQELQWLLGQSIPKSIGQIAACLSGISFLSTKTNNTGAAAAAAAKHASTQVDLVSTGNEYKANADASGDSDAVKGTATITGTVVTQLSLRIAISSHLNQGKPMTIYLKKDESLPLRQAQDAQSYLKSALSKAQNAPAFVSAIEALRYTEDMLNSLQYVKHILVVGGQQSLMPLQSDNAEKFAPALPENLVIECSLKKDVLVTHVYWLKFRHSFKSTGLLDAFKKEQSTGHTLVHNGRPAEIKRELVFQANIPSMRSSIELIDNAVCTCIDVIGQLHAFDSM